MMITVMVHLPSTRLVYESLLTPTFNYISDTEHCMLAVLAELTRMMRVQNYAGSGKMWQLPKVLLIHKMCIHNSSTSQMILSIMRVIAELLVHYQ